MVAPALLIALEVATRIKQVDDCRAVFNAPGDPNIKDIIDLVNQTTSCVNLAANNNNLDEITLSASAAMN